MKYYRVLGEAMAAVMVLCLCLHLYGGNTEPAWIEYDQGNVEDRVSMDDVKPMLALSFDDGPHPVYTKKLLDGLRERGVKATFFVMGKSIPGREDIIKQMYEDGHLIGNHTYDHVKLTALSEEDACQQILKTCQIVEEITGEPTEYVRPPFGEWNTQLDCGISLFPVLWDVDPLDWTTQNTEQVVNRVVTEVKENDIILLHDIYESSVDAALSIVDILMERGYRFVTVDEIILE